MADHSVTDTTMGQITFGINLRALQAQRQIDRAHSFYSQSLERISSGLRINHASDDAAGLAVSSSLTRDTRVYTQAIQNGNDAISALNISDGGLDSLSSIVIRLKELAEQSANGSLSRTQRVSNDLEGKSLGEEFNRIISSLEFNGLGILNGNLGELGIQLGFGSSGAINVGFGTKIARKIGTGLSSSTFTSSGATGTLNAMTSGDFNGDGNLDIVTHDGINGTYLSLGNGDGTFGAKSLIAGAGTSTSIRAVDVNNDGKLDLIRMASPISFETLIGAGNGTFTSAGSTTGASSVLNFGDFNGDGLIDVVGYRSAGRIYLNTGNGDGTFNAATSVAFSGAVDISIGDFNGDGRPDIAALSASALTIIQVDSSGNLTAGSSISVSSASKLQSADFNYDGILDLSYSSATGNTVSVLLGIGDATFNSATSYSATGANGLRANDLDGDGITDLIAANSSNQLIFMKGRGDGTFDSAISYSTTLTAGTIIIDDFSNDGVNDLVSYSGTNIASTSSTTTNSSSIKRVNLTTRDQALSAFATLDSTLDRIQNQIGMNGALESRILAALANLQGQRLGSQDAAARIMNVDIAEESALLIKNQVLRDAAGAVLANSKLEPQIALQLLS